MTSPNGLICFTNCLLPHEDGSLVEQDLWIDERRGTILDAQRTFYLRKERPARIVDLKGNILSPGFIDSQINGAYGFDFSVYEDDDSYRQGMKTVAERIVETGVTSLLPTLITQDKALYPKLLSLLRPFSTPTSATLLGWHAEGPFLNNLKRGAHAPPFLLTAPEGTATFEDVYGEPNLVDNEDWLMSGDGHTAGVRMITAAPEIDGVMNAIAELTKRGIVFSIGHSVCSSETATAAVRHGAAMITHLFNAMPQLHHRDPAIIGLLGASPHLSSPLSPLPPHPPRKSTFVSEPGISRPVHHIPTAILTEAGHSEAFDDTATPPLSPFYFGNSLTSPTSNTQSLSDAVAQLTVADKKGSRSELHLEKGQVADMAFVRPYYGLIVDGIHSHPNSVRLAYSAHPDGCIIITDGNSAMKILDPHLRDGVHEWRDGQRFIKDGYKLYLEGTTTLAGSVVTLDTSIRNFSRFTGCSLGEAIKCATYNPAKCLGIEHKKGTLRPGADADLTVLDRRGIVLSTWVRGKEAWVKGA
ncbi:N-acetylglucosamine-6-phosphate deacetylase [Hypsizygus marmoreus]|uniref:N-acetylglucosamine-6-phosphate deacetylase n=1 Tax=Hypsizygus marmoreus TaxID=39966 RepID=A0A369JT67_HYPMA|nr:N-acetylglucosamine-6-phosphate deacetylase [Hypsizygus marmoreus]